MATKTRYVVTMSETGGAEIVEASSHEDALRKVNPLFRYVGGEWPDYDSADTVLKALAKFGARFERCVASEGFVEKYGREGSTDYPPWDKAAGCVKALSSRKMDEDALVYPTT